jgi:sugar phosphate isomerase/epimerase
MIDKLAASNIAWPFAERNLAYLILAEYGVKGLEIAPGLLFSDAADPFIPTQVMIEERLSEIERAGLQLVSMQSLMFGATDVRLFGSDRQRLNFISAIGRAIDLAARLAIPHLVLGSPRERAIPEAMSKDNATSVASRALVQLACAAHASRCAIGLEPNPAIYGTNFINTTSEAISLICAINCAGLALNLDVGSILANDEIANLESIVREHVEIIGHVHISEPFLAPAPADVRTTERLIEALDMAGYARWTSLEMRSTGETWRETLQQSLQRLRTIF